MSPIYGASRRVTGGSKAGTIDEGTAQRRNSRQKAWGHGASGV
ncbi:hypothetical protein WCU81_05270 [Pectobacterium atrosepticum]|nr:hypothetical protein [Pectobacterium atrosepticum]